MRVAAYQFLISNNISKNVDAIENALSDAKEHKAELVVFAECCLTGYPSRDIDHSSDVDFEGVESGTQISTDNTPLLSASDTGLNANDNTVPNDANGVNSSDENKTRNRI